MRKMEQRSRYSHFLSAPLASTFIPVIDHVRGEALEVLHIAGLEQDVLLY